MAIAFRGRLALSAINGNGVTQTPNAPGTGSAAVDGDIILVVSSTFNRSSNEGRIGNALSYTQIADLTSGTQRIRAAYKIYVSGEDSVVIEGSANAADGISSVAIWFSGVDTSNPFSTTSTTATGSSTNPNPPSITPAHDDCMIWVGAGSSNTDASPGTITNYTDGFGQAGNDVNDSVTHQAWRLLSGGGGAAEDPGAWPSWSTGNWGVVTVALKPLIADVLMGQAML